MSLLILNFYGYMSCLKGYYLKPLWLRPKANYHLFRLFTTHTFTNPSWHFRDEYAKHDNQSTALPLLQTINTLINAQKYCHCTARQLHNMYTLMHNNSRIRV